MTTMKNAFTFEGKTYEVNDKGNRFFETDLAKGYCRKRIGEAAYERAWENYLQTKEDQANDDNWKEEGDNTDVTLEDELAQWDAEIREREERQRKSDEEAEAAVNEKPKTKKIRRSKDIAFEGVFETGKGDSFKVNKITLTSKQVDFIKHIPDTCFYENGLESTMWCDVLADEIGGQFAGKPMTVGAMVSTLREKSLIYVSTDRINGRKAKFFGFTDLGKMVAKEMGLE